VNLEGSRGSGTGVGGFHGTERMRIRRGGGQIGCIAVHKRRKNKKYGLNGKFFTSM